MTRFCVHFVRGAQHNLALAAAIFGLAVVVNAQSTVASDSAPAGRLNFDAVKLPAANLEVDLSQEMFRDLFGIGDAAISGIAETLLKSATGGEGAQGAKIAAEQMEATRQIVQLAGDVVREVRVRAYEKWPDDAGAAADSFKAFDDQLQTGKWETIVRVRDDEQVARVAILRHAGVIQGVFVVATDGEGVVLANLVCDISPENVKKLTSTATKIGLANGLGKAIEIKLKHLPGEVKSHDAAVRTIRVPAVVAVAPVAPAAPTPPTPPTPPVPEIK